MAVDNHGGGNGFSRDAEEDRSDVPSGGGNSRHPKEKRKSLHWGHWVNKGKHQGQSDRPANARQDSHYEADGNPHQLENECLPGKELDQAVERGIEDIDHRRIPAGHNATAAPPQKMDRWPPLHFFLTPRYQKLRQFGLECRTELIKAGHHLGHGGAINLIDVYLRFFRLHQEIRIAQRFYEGLLEKLETILRNSGRHAIRPRALRIGAIGDIKKRP